MRNPSAAKVNHQVDTLSNDREMLFFETIILVPMSRPMTEKAPNYPSSSQRAKDWNKLEAQIKKDEKDNKEDTGDANA